MEVVPWQCRQTPCRPVSCRPGPRSAASWWPARPGRHRDRHQPGRGGRRRRPHRGQRDRRRPRLGHHAAGQRAARTARARRLGPGRGAGVRLQQPGAARARPGRHAARRDARRAAPAARTCRPPVGMSRPALARILRDRAAQAGASIRLGTSYTALRQDDGRRRRRPSPTARPAATTWWSGPTASGRATRRMLGIERETAAAPGWASGGRSVPGPPASPAPTCTTAARSYIAGYCPTGEDTLYAYIVEDAQDRSALSPEERLAVMRGLAAGLPRPVGRHPRRR